MDIMIMIMRAATRERGKVERRQAGGGGSGQEIGKDGREVGAWEGGPPPPMPPSKDEMPVYCSKPTPVNHQTLELKVGQGLLIH